MEQRVKQRSLTAGKPRLHTRRPGHAILNTNGGGENLRSREGRVAARNPLARSGHDGATEGGRQRAPPCWSHAAQNLDLDRFCLRTGIAQTIGHRPPSCQGTLTRDVAAHHSTTLLCRATTEPGFSVVCARRVPHITDLNREISLHHKVKIRLHDDSAILPGCTAWRHPAATSFN